MSSRPVDPGFPITASDEKAWYLEVARQSHLRGLSVGMKNGVEVVDSELVSAFDWALTEQCFEYQECLRFKPFVDAGKAVFQVEYGGSPSRFCAQSRRLGFSAIRKRPALGRWRHPCAGK